MEGYEDYEDHQLTHKADRPALVHWLIGGMRLERFARPPSRHWLIKCEPPAGDGPPLLVRAATDKVAIVFATGGLDFDGDDCRLGPAAEDGSRWLEEGHVTVRSIGWVML
ncbi:MAG TPA: hypothetical protein VLF67_04330 [Candidatus Saccharimonas sp.]|nr:hypothetical protein [Candidatus Saccharimonas sp.]